MIPDDGYIKFICRWSETKPLKNEDIKDINIWRKKLFDLKLIGVYPNKIGYGNISKRKMGTDGFMITGSATGSLSELVGDHYTEVIAYDIKKNTLDCIGPIRASSESLSHAAIYSTDKRYNAVIHVHNLDLWKNLYGKVATTDKDAEFGSPEIADEISRIIHEEKRIEPSDGGLIVMGGHREGIISYGTDLDTAGNIILEAYKKNNKNK